MARRRVNTNTGFRATKDVEGEKIVFFLCVESSINGLAEGSRVVVGGSRVRTTQRWRTHCNNSSYYTHTRSFK